MNSLALFSLCAIIASATASGIGGIALASPSIAASTILGNPLGATTITRSIAAPGIITTRSGLIGGPGVITSAGLIAPGISAPGLIASRGGLIAPGLIASHGIASPGVIAARNGLIASPWGLAGQPLIGNGIIGSPRILTSSGILGSPLGLTKTIW